MTSRSPFTFHHVTARPRSISHSSLQTFPPERYPNILVRRPAGFIRANGKLTLRRENYNNNAGQQRLTKQLLNVNIERSLGPVQVILSPEQTTKDLIKAAIEIYLKEQRRPLLKETDPNRYELHYSRFSLESLKPGEKLINLASRNFFLCSKPPNSLNFSCKEEAKLPNNSLVKLMDLLLQTDRRSRLAVIYRI